MNTRIRFATTFALLLVITSALLAGESVHLTDNWRFARGERPGAESADFDASGWRTVSLPHDWSIESAPFAEAPSEGGGGYFPTGEAWYRRTFEAPGEWGGKHVTVYFEGVYRNAEVWLNGERLGTHANGYTPFRFNLGPHLKLDEANVLAVHVVNQPQPNSRWYTGSGIYRGVRLEIEEPLRFAFDRIFVQTRHLRKDAATLAIEAEVLNDTEAIAESTLGAVVRTVDGTEVARAEEVRSVDARNNAVYHLTFSIEQPRPWTPENPYLYSLTLTLRKDGALFDSETFAVGLRTVAVSSARGLLLNGEPVLLYGGNVHHDTGPLGAAAYPEAEERKVRLLKAAGFNAVRTAHNPPSTAFLDACDRLGMLVIDEAFDSWKAKKIAHDYGEIFDQHWESDLRAFVRRDRNHPSVIMWSIGNEVYERGDPQGIERAHALAGVVRQLDRTRPVTIGLNGLGETGDWTRLDGVFAALDVAGYNYELAARYAEDHRRRPNRVIYASESYQSEAFTNWRIMRDEPHVIGDFVWTALDYLGEAGIGRVFPPGEEARPHWEGSHFPWHGAYTGDIDLIGTRKPISFYRQIVWDRGASLYAAVLKPTNDGRPWNPSQWAVEPFKSSWTWPGHEGTELTVEVYSRHEEVKLLLNGKVVGEAKTGIENAFKATFSVPYAPGKLTAQGIDGGKTVEEFDLETVGEPRQLWLQSASQQLRANGQDLAFIAVEVRDDQGRLHPSAEPAIRYSIDGPGEIIAIGSSDLSSDERYQQNPRHAAEGRALVVVRTTNEPGNIQLSAEAEGLGSASVILGSVSPEPSE